MKAHGVAFLKNTAFFVGCVLTLHAGLCTPASVASCEKAFENQKTVEARREVFRILDQDKDAIQSRLDIIASAKSEILVSYFIFNSDRVSTLVLAALREAARRGVKIKFILDHSFSLVPRGMIEHLRDEGFEIRFFHKFDITNPQKHSRRLHDKLIIVDGGAMILGGRNFEKVYFGQGKKAENYVDRDAYIEGYAAEIARNYFYSIWVTDHVEEVRYTVSKEKRDIAGKILDSSLKSLMKGSDFVLNSDRPFDPEGLCQTGCIFYHNEIRDGQNHLPTMAIQLARKIAAARKSVLIETPYLVPDAQFIRLIKRLVDRGVEVTFLTNSLASTDGLIPFAGYMQAKRTLVATGARVFEYAGKGRLHAKSMVIDGIFSMVGSYNNDPRSRYLNLEIGAGVEDADIAAKLEASIRGHMKKAWEVGRDGRLIGTKTQYPGVDSLKKIILMEFFRAFGLPFFKDQI